MHEIEQLSGTEPRIKSTAEIQTISLQWDALQPVTYPYMVYMPEKDRLLMLLMYKGETKAGVVSSSDGGATWTRPKYVGDGWSIDLSYLGGGTAVFKRADRYWFSHDYGETWEDSVPAPGCEDGKPFDEDSPFLVDRDAKTGRVTRLWATGKKPGLACLYRCSDDVGRTWSSCRHISQWGRTGEIVLHRVDDDNLIAACRVSLPQFEGKLDHYSGLGVSVSGDNGQSWSDLNILYAWGRHMSSLVTLDTGDIVLTHVVREGYVRTEDGYPQFGIEAVISRDKGRTWDLDHRYLLAVWKGSGKAAEEWHASPQRTATVLLPNGMLVTAFGTGYRSKEFRINQHCPQDIGVVRWRVHDEKRSSDTTIRDAPFDSDARNVFDPQISRYGLNDPGWSRRPAGQGQT